MPAGRRHRRRSGKRGAPALPAAVATMITGALPLTFTGALAVQMRGDLHFSEAGLGLGVLAYFGTSALASPFGGRLAQRLGTVTSMRVTAVVCALSLLGIGAARSWAQVLVLLAVAGAGASLAQPACNALLVRAGRPERRGLAFGINQSSIPASTLLGGVAVPVLALTFGWRWAFAAAAVTAVLTVRALTPRTAPWAAASVDPHQGHDDHTEPGNSQRSGTPVGEWRLAMAVLAVSGAFGSGAYSALGAFGVASGVAAGLGPGVAGIFHAVGSLASICVRVLVGWLAGRRGPARVSSLLAVVGGMQIAGSVGLALMATGRLDTFVPGALLAYGVGWGVAGLFNFSISRRYQAHTAAATGIIHLGVFGGAGSAPALFGLLASHVSLTSAWLLMAAFSVVSAILVLTLVRADRGRAHPKGAPADAPASA